MAHTLCSGSAGQAGANVCWQLAVRGGPESEVLDPGFRLGEVLVVAKFYHTESSIVGGITESSVNDFSLLFVC